VSESLQLTIVYEQGEDGWVIASIPEVPGAHSQGKTREEARENVIDALRGILELRFGEHPETPAADSGLLELAIGGVKRRDLERHLRAHGVRLLREGATTASGVSTPSVRLRCRAIARLMSRSLARSAGTLASRRRAAHAETLMVVRCTTNVLGLLGVRPAALAEVAPAEDDWYWDRAPKLHESFFQKLSKSERRRLQG
jgi:antitoxin HicB